METTVVKVLEVNSKQVKTQHGVGIVYNIKGSDDREYSTFDKKLGPYSGTLRGQNAVISYEVVDRPSKDGSRIFTNYYLKAIQPVDGDTPAAEVPSPVSVSAGAVSHNITPKGSFDDKSEQINRSVAFKAAVELTASGFFQVSNIDDLDKLTKQLIPIVDGTYAATGEVAGAVAQAVVESADAGLIDF